MHGSTIRKHIWLIDKLASNPGMTYPEINDAWQRALHVNPDEEDLPVRTFNNWKTAIFDEFGLSIVCNRSTKTYSIEHLEDIRQGSTYEWLLNAFTVSNMLAERDAMEGRVILEHVPSGQQYLKPIVDAMKANRRVVIIYKKFDASESYDVDIEPYFVKLYERRWYVIGRHVEKEVMRTYALDRIVGIKLLDKTFKLPKDFNAQEYHTDCFGITRLDDENPINVKLRVDAVQCDYLRTLKLHHTQEEIETTDDYSIFSLRVFPTWDFVQALLAQGHYIEVLEPQDFRETFAEILYTMADKYIDDED